MKKWMTFCAVLVVLVALTACGQAMGNSVLSREHTEFGCD